MLTIFYVHWNEADLRERVAALEATAYPVATHWSTETGAKFPRAVPGRGRGLT